MCKITISTFHNYFSRVLVGDFLLFFFWVHVSHLLDFNLTDTVSFDIKYFLEDPTTMWSIGSVVVREIMHILKQLI